jgi:hypothetical protein
MATADDIEKELVYQGDDVLVPLWSPFAMKMVYANQCFFGEDFSIEDPKVHARKGSKLFIVCPADGMKNMLQAIRDNGPMPKGIRPSEVTKFVYYTQLFSYTYFCSEPPPSPPPILPPSERPCPPITTLPRDVNGIILSRLRLDRVLVCTRVCKLWKSLIEERVNRVYKSSSEAFIAMLDLVSFFGSDERFRMWLHSYAHPKILTHISSVQRLAFLCTLTMNMAELAQLVNWQRMELISTDHTQSYYSVVEGSYAHKFLDPPSALKTFHVKTSRIDMGKFTLVLYEAEGFKLKAMDRLYKFLQRYWMFLYRRHLGDVPSSDEHIEAISVYLYDTPDAPEFIRALHRWYKRPDVSLRIGRIRDLRMAETRNHLNDLRRMNNNGGNWWRSLFSCFGPPRPQYQFPRLTTLVNDEHDDMTQYYPRAAMTEVDEELASVRASVEDTAAQSDDDEEE